LVETGEDAEHGSRRGDQAGDSIPPPFCALSGNPLFDSFISADLLLATNEYMTGADDFGEWGWYFI